MWKCNHCKKTVDAELIDCWNCGYSQEGLPPDTEVLSQIKEAKQEQKLERENEKYRADRLKNKASSLRLPAIAVAGIFMFLLFFHIVPAHLTVFPKRSPSFADIKVIYQGECLSISGRSKLSFAIGRIADDKTLHLAITSNSGSGMWCEDWASASAIQDVVLRNSSFLG
jgi:hypothetical protein